MVFRLFHSLRRKHLWLVLGALCFAAAVLGYQGVGIDRLFDGDPTRLLFAGLGGIGIATAGYWISRSTYNVFKHSRFAWPLVIAAALFTAGGVFDVQAFLADKVGKDLVAALIYVGVVAVGVMTMFGLRKKKSGHFSRGNQPGA